MLELARRALSQRMQERTVFATPDAVKHYPQLHLSARHYEVFGVLLLRQLVLRAMHHQAAAVALSHNHPSGTVQPSRAYEMLTQTLKTMLALIDMRVLDHVIVASGEALSMAEWGLL